MVQPSPARTLQTSSALQACRPGGLCPTQSSAVSPLHPAHWGSGLTTQSFHAARVVGQGPGLGHEAGPATFLWLVPGLALHRDALHRHGAFITHAGLAVADPPLSGLQQTRSGSPRALGWCPGLWGCVQQRVRPQPSACGLSTQPPPLWSRRVPVMRFTPGCPHQPLPGPGGAAALRWGPPPSSCSSKESGSCARNTHEFGKPIWSHAGWEGRTGRKGVTGSAGVGAQQAWPPPPPNRGLFFLLGTEASGELQGGGHLGGGSGRLKPTLHLWQDWVGRAQAGVCPPRGPPHPALRGWGGPRCGVAYGTRAHRRPCVS